MNTIIFIFGYKLLSTIEFCVYLSAKPQLSCEVFLHDVVWKLDPEVSVGALVGDELVHDAVANVEHFVLTLAQVRHQQRAPLRVLAAVKAVQLGGHQVERLVGVEKLRQQGSVILLQIYTKTTLGFWSGLSGGLSLATMRKNIGL